MDYFGEAINIKIIFALVLSFVFSPVLVPIGMLFFLAVARMDFAGAPKPGWWTYFTGAYTLYPCWSIEEDQFNRCMTKKDWPYGIFLYPLRDRRANATSYERSLIHRLTFLEAVKRVNGVAETPEHYGYLNNSCATNTMRIGNLAIGSITRKHRRKGLWRRGLLWFLSHTEEGMQRLLFDEDLIDI